MEVHIDFLPKTKTLRQFKVFETTNVYLKF